MTRTCRLSCLVLALAVSVVNPAFADTYFVYNDGGIPPGSDIYTWCDSPPCDVGTLVTCDTPEGGASLNVNTNLWGGLGVIMLGSTADLTDYESGELRFFVRTAYDLKVEIDCLLGDPPVVQTYTQFISDHNWNDPNDPFGATWQEISIAASDFIPDPATRQECLAQTRYPFKATIADLPFFNSFRVDHVRWHKANSGPGASSVEVQGRQLLVDGEPFVVNGMDYAPIAIGENWQGAWRDRPDRYLVDFPLIAASGANTVRLYAPLVSKAMLDAAWAEGLYVIPTFGVNPEQLTCNKGRNFMRDRFLEMVNEWKDHPAILLWLVGNETNLNLGSADLCLDWYPQLDSLAAAAHAEEGLSFHPVGTATAEIGDICVSGCSDDSTLPNVDFWATQLYRGCSFTGRILRVLREGGIVLWPLIVTEFGMDAYDSLLAAENQTLQANCLGSLVNEANQALAVRDPGGVSSGQVIFAWSDEWWKADEVCGTGWENHDGCTSFENLSYPDPGINEEWWGMVSLDDADPDARGLRTAYTTVADSWWGLGPVLNLRVVTYDSGSGNTSITFDPASGSDDHTLYYGPLGAVASYSYSGSAALGASGSGSATLPPDSLFFVVVGRTHGAEGCYGKDSACAERPASPGAGIPQTANRDCSVPQCP